MCGAASCCTVYLRARWDPLGIVNLRKLMSQTFETMCPLKGLLEGHGAQFRRRVRVGTILRVTTMAESKD